MYCEIYNDSDLIEKQKTQEAPHKGSLAASACRCSVQISLHFENETKQTWTIEVRKIQKFPSNQQEQDFLLVVRSECERCRRSYVCVCNFSPWVYCQSFEVIWQWTFWLCPKKLLQRQQLMSKHPVVWIQLLDEEASYLMSKTNKAREVSPTMLKLKTSVPL